MANFTIKCDPNRVTKALDNERKRVVRNLLDVVSRKLVIGAEMLKGKMRRAYTEGRTAPGGLAEISRKLIRTVKVVPPQIGTDTITGSISVGSPALPYSQVVMGPLGQETIITPKNAKALAIPTKFARTAKGVPRGPAYIAGVPNPIWGITFIAAGMVFGYQRGTARKYAKPVPLFVLKKSVVVKAKLDPKEEFANVIVPQIRAEVRKLIKSGSSTTGPY